MEGADLVVWPDIFRKSSYEAGNIALEPIPVPGFVLLLELAHDADGGDWETDTMPPPEEDPELAAVYFLFHHSNEEVAERAAAWLREQWSSDEERVYITNGIVRNNLSRLDVNPLPAENRLVLAANMAVWENGRGWLLPA